MMIALLAQVDIALEEHILHVKLQVNTKCTDRRCPLTTQECKISLQMHLYLSVSRHCCIALASDNQKEGTRLQGMPQLPHLCIELPQALGEAYCLNLLRYLWVRPFLLAKLTVAPEKPASSWNQ